MDQNDEKKENIDNNSCLLYISSYTEGRKTMVDCPGLRPYKASYLFDSIINQGMIWVKFDCRQNKLHKVLS